MRQIILFLFTLLIIWGCEKESTEPPEPEYLDLQWIWAAKQETYDCADEYWCDENLYPGIHRSADTYYRGEKPEIPSELFQDGVKWVYHYSHKCKWIHYYKNEKYIEFEEVGEDQIESEDVDGLIIVYEEIK